MIHVKGIIHNQYIIPVCQFGMVTDERKYTEKEHWPHRLCNCSGSATPIIESSILA